MSGTLNPVDGTTTIPSVSGGQKPQVTRTPASTKPDVYGATEPDEGSSEEEE
jgi:hypothetical protein